MSETAERKEEFTPGPWEIGRIVDFNIEIDAPNGEPDFGVVKWTGLATVYGSEDEDGGLEKGKTNAALIAAAPDMYAALKAMIEHYGDDWADWADTGINDAARAALAKARGEA